MRLDEWQKWLESQFLDDDAEDEAGPEKAAPPVPPAAVPPPATVQPRPATVGAPPRLPEPAEAPVPADVQRPAPGVTPPQRRGPEPHLQQAPAQTPTNGPSTADDKVPALSEYMPFLRAPQTAPVTAPPTPEPPAETPAAAAESADAQLAAQPAPHDLAPSEQESEPTPEPDKPAAEPPRPAGPPRAPAVAAVDAAPAPPVPSTPPQVLDAAPVDAPAVRRSRYARTVASAEVPPLEPAALWSLVPRHLQTLLAMEGDDAARGAYKRAFRESRVELVRRLLDPTLSLEETARLLGVCPTTVRRYTNRGLLTHQRTAGDQRRFKLSDVLTFMEAQSRART